jgi:hypothetical protein
MGVMAYALVGTKGAVTQGAAGAAVTPGWGASESRTANNLLICWVGVTGSATLPTTPAGWSIGVQKAGTSCSMTVYYLIAAGTDAAPTIALIASGVITAQLAEFSGNVTSSPLDQSGSAAGTTSTQIATNGAKDQAIQDLNIGGSAVFYSVSATKSFSNTLNNGATATATENSATNTANHYDFYYSANATGNASADTETFSFTTTSVTGDATVIVSFKVSQQSPAIIADNVKLTDTGAITVSIYNKKISVSDNVTVTDTGAVTMKNSGWNTIGTIADNVTVTDTGAVTVRTRLTLSVSDNLTVQDALVYYSDSIYVQDSVTLSLTGGGTTTWTINVSDNINVSESAPQQEHNLVNLADNINVSENISAQVPTVYISVYDSVTTTDTGTTTIVEANLPTGVIYDSTSVSESVSANTVSPGSVSINVSDNVTVTDTSAITVLEKNLVTGIVYDSVNISESITSWKSVQTLNVYDSIAVSEFESSVTALINVSDNINVSESVTVYPTSTWTLADFESKTSKWTLVSGNSMSFVAKSGHGTVMEVVCDNNASNETHRNFTPTNGSNCYKDFTYLELDINLNGATLQGGDQSAFGFDQGGWKYVSLVSYVTNGSSSWQHVQIPIADLVSAGLNVNAVTGYLVCRFYPTLGAMTIDIDNIIFTGGIYANYTQPTLPSLLPQHTWKIQSVDTMKISKDTMGGQWTQGQINSEISVDAKLGVTHITIDCPYDDYSTYSPVITSGYKTKFITPIRNAGLKVWHRSHWNSWEGDYGSYGFVKKTPTSSPSMALGDSVSVLNGTDTSSYMYQTYNYILTHSSEFQAGDIFTPACEVENTGVGAGSTNMFADYPTLWKWMRDSITVCNEAFKQIGLGGQVFVGLWGNSGFTALNNLDERTVDSGTWLTIDHYIWDTAQMTTDLSNIYSYYGDPIIIGEWGDYNDSDPTTNKTLAYNMFGIFQSNSNVVGANYWNDIGGSYESLFNSSYIENPNASAIEYYFRGTYIPSIYDSVNISESVTVSVSANPPATVNVSDSVTTTDTGTLTIIEKNLVTGTVYDSVNVSENITATSGPQHLSVYDSINVSENISSSIPSNQTSVYDSINVSENITTSAKFNPSIIADSVNVSENISVTIPTVYANVYDSTNVSESITGTVPNCTLNISDSITVSESVSANIPSGQVSIYDSITVSENITTSPTFKPGIIYDSISVSESIATNSVNYLSVYDSITINDGPSGEQTTQYVVVNDNVNVSENVSAAAQAGGINIYDSINISESITAQAPNVQTSIYDTVNVSENITTLPKLGGINVYDSIQVSESITSQVVNPISVFDSVTANDSIDYALKFAGVNSWAGVTLNNLTLGNQITIAGWVMVNAFKTNGSYEPDDWIAGTNWPTQGFYFELGRSFSPGTNNQTPAVTFCNGTTSPVGATSSTPIVIGTKYHIIGTLDGTNVKIYINNVLKGTNSGFTGSYTNYSSMFIGMEAPTTWGGLNGLVDDVRIYNREITPTERAALYAGTEISSTSLMAWWKMNEGTGTTLADNSGNGNTATFSGTTLPVWVNGLLPSAAQVEEIYSISVSDSIQVSENISAIIPTISTTVYDSVSVSENITSKIPNATVNVYDSISVSESITSIVPSGRINIYDSVSASESITTTNISSINVYDSISAAENFTYPVLFSDNFETGNLSKWSSQSITSGNTLEVKSTSILSGTYALHIVDVNTSADGNAYTYVGLASPNHATLAQFDLYVVATPSGNSVPIIYWQNDSWSDYAYLIINTNNTFYVQYYDGSNYQYYSGLGNFNLNTKYSVSFYIDDSAGTIVLIVNGVVLLNVTGLTINAGLGAKQLRFGSVFTSSTNSEFYLDNLVVSNTSGQIQLVTQPVVQEVNSSSIYDNITVNDGPAGPQEVQYIVVNDNLNVSENVIVLPQSGGVNVTDGVSVSESVNTFLPKLTLSIYDSINISESATSFIPTYLYSLSDSITVSENITATVPSGQVSVYDAISVSENITAKTTTVYASISDSITVSENITSAQVFYPTIIYDSITVSESLPEQEVVTINVYDSVTVNDNISGPQDVNYLSVYDSVSVSENITVLPQSGGISLYDTINISESVTQQIPKGQTTVFDSVSISENISALIPTYLVSVYDSITVSENNPEQQINTVNVYDSITVSENITTSPTTRISVYDSIVVSESNPEQEQNSISVYDSLTTSDNVTMFMSGGKINVYDSIIVSESLPTVEVLRIDLEGQEISGVKLI